MALDMRRPLAVSALEVRGLVRLWKFVGRFGSERLRAVSALKGRGPFRPWAVSALKLHLWPFRHAIWRAWWIVGCFGPGGEGLPHR